VIRAMIPGWKIRRTALPMLLVAGITVLPGHLFGADGGGVARVAEHVTLTNGFDLICDHREQNGDRVRLYTEGDNVNFVEVDAKEVASVEMVTLPAIATKPAGVVTLPSAAHGDLTKAELHELLSQAGAQHNLDVNLLASVVRAESGGHTAATSKKGAQGLMQLMPTTAAQLGVNDRLRPDENVAGGAKYLDSLLTRYHDNLALALAAYNAGPAAVDRYHGVPPYRETRLYVAHIIRDFNASVRTANRLSIPKQQTASMIAAAGPAQVVPVGATAP
jgi:hypothetical protein